MLLLKGLIHETTTLNSGCAYARVAWPTDGRFMHKLWTHLEFDSYTLRIDSSVISKVRGFNFLGFVITLEKNKKIGVKKRILLFILKWLQNMVAEEKKGGGRGEKGDTPLECQYTHDA